MPPPTPQQSAMLLYPSPPSSPKQAEDSNLQNFLKTVTPYISLKSVSKKTMETLNTTDGKSPIDYFNLKDFWEGFEKWSAYGVGVPVLLNNGDTVVQYYAPHLSSIQIFTIKEPAYLFGTRGGKGKSSSYTHKISSSGGDEPANSWDADAIDSTSTAVNENSLGHLYFQFCDFEPPYERVTLHEKIAYFSKEFPGILSLKSVDLAPASWVSISWYPIYHIPMEEAVNVKDLSTNFLTYHTLSSSFDGESAEEAAENGIHGGEHKRNKKVGLPSIFGLATYKLQGDLWCHGGQKDRDKMQDLHNAAESWLKQRNFNHHDFQLFTTQF